MSIKRLASQPVANGLIGAFCVAAMLFVHLRRSPRIFDIEFADETIYLGKAVMAPPGLMNSYEDSGLYSLVYRFLHVFIGDTVALYLWGGTIIVAVCGLAIYASIRIISGSAVYGMIVCSAFIFSSAFRAWPRPSYAAIAVIAAGLCWAHFARPWFAKAAIVTLTAFLATFIRAEFILAFYAFGLISLALALFEVFGAVQRGSPRRLVRLELVPAWIAIVVVLTLIGLWSLPILRDSDRAFFAFCQHYSLRYVKAHGLSINPWQNCAQFIGPLFPGATTLREAFHVAPALYINFLIENAFDTLNILGRLLSEWFRPGTDRLRSYLGLVLIIIGGAFLARLAWTNRRSGRRAVENSPILADAGAALVFIVPPLLSCIMVYPRVHYSIMVLYFLFVGSACLVRWYFDGVPSVTTTLLLGVGLVLATPALPRVEQPTVQTIATIRAIPDIKVLFEADLGWCTYYRPPCRAVWPRPKLDGFKFTDRVKFADRIKEEHPDAIMLSNGLRALQDIEDDPMYRQLKSDPRSLGYEALSLPQGRTLLLKR